MEMIMIDENKLKITLTAHDMRELDISAEEFDYSKVTTKNIIWGLLHKAKHETGFNADESKLYIQLFNSTDGGCEMYIMKERYNCIHQYSAQTYRIKRSEESPGYFLILNFKELCLLCNRIIDENKKLHTSLYYNNAGAYILLVQKRTETPSYFSDKSEKYMIPNYLSEYGEIHTLNEKVLYYFEEHYKKIACGNAAELLSNIKK